MLQLTSLDISRNPALTELRCGINRLTSLDVSHNPALVHLECDFNELTDLDLSRNPALKDLQCGNNRLTSLDLSHNPALKGLRCSANQLTSLDVSACPALVELARAGKQPPVWSSRAWSWFYEECDPDNTDYQGFFLHFTTDDGREFSAYKYLICDDTVTVTAGDLVIPGEGGTATYTILYDANGGTGAPAAQTKTRGAALTLSGVKPARDGYTFLGWAASKTAAAAQYQPGDRYSNDAGVTLYAVWEAAAPVATAAPTPTPAPEAPTLTIASDGTSAQAAGDCAGLYARVALILDNNGQTGLYVTQVTINEGGTILVPAFMVPGLTVKAVNISLVGSLADIQSPTPTTVAMAFKYIQR